MSAELRDRILLHPFPVVVVFPARSGAGSITMLIRREEDMSEQIWSILSILFLSDFDHTDLVVESVSKAKKQHHQVRGNLSVVAS